MINWADSMEQTFEYYIVDPGTWRDVRLIDTITSCDITHDTTSETLGSASIGITESLGECYIRIYLIAEQHDIKDKIALGTFLVQTPTYSFDGKVKNVKMDAYTPLMELKESPPPLGYSIDKGVNIMDISYRLAREHMRAPISPARSDTLLYDDFIASPNDTWLQLLKDLIAKDKYDFALDEMGRVLFAPIQDMASLQPVWIYTDDNSSILYPQIDMDNDLYGVPNVVEVIYSSGHSNYYARVVNDDPNSPLSTVSRGREIVHRVTNPDKIGDPTKNQVDEYAMQVLRELSSLQYKLTYTHGFCPVRVGDCILLNYERSGLKNIKAKVISQTIRCSSGCEVSETAVFTNNLWR